MIEVTDFYYEYRVSINIENIIKIEEDSERDTCNIYLNMSDEPIECKESYNNVLSKIKEARND